MATELPTRFPDTPFARPRLERWGPSWCSAVADIVFGTLWYRLLATRQDLDNQLVDDLIETLC